MLGAFLYVESRSPEPMIPLVLFRNPVISICSICVFLLGVGMFGVIIYLPLFMQGVLGVSATRSGNLLTPLMMGAVVGSFGERPDRVADRQVQGRRVLGSIFVAIGMVLFARMDADTARSYVALGMIVSGLGMGLLQPVYTVAVQNVAPRAQMGAATSSTIFFRSIGSTVGVAAFGSIMLTRYHSDFARAVPSQVPPGLLTVFFQSAAADADASADRSQLRADARRIERAECALCRGADFARTRHHGDLFLERRDYERGGAYPPCPSERTVANAGARTGIAHALRLSI